MNRHVLLIAGGGTLGMYTAKELARLGDQVDVICLEDNLSTESIHFYKDRVDIAYLTAFLENRHYDTIVNFLHYTNAEAYAPYHTLLTAKCDQLIVLSSYRVYADLQHPVTETAPLLGDTSTDTEFLEKETYAMGKTRCERYIRAQEAKNWTIIRPVISFSARRLDVIMHSGHTVVEAARENRTLLVPMGAKEMHAGLDWAGNSGKLIAHLAGKPETIGETYTITTAQNLRWGDVAEIYTDLLGVQFQWIPDEAYMENKRDWALLYDRLFDRYMDAAKVLAATGLRREDFTDIRDGVRYELTQLGIKTKS